MRASWSLPAFATLVTLAFLVVSSVSPNQPSLADAVTPAPVQAAQSFALHHVQHPGATRDDYAVSRVSTAPSVGIPDAGTVKAIAYDMVLARGWNQAEYECLVALWQR